MAVTWDSICDLAAVRVGSNPTVDLTSGTDKVSVACAAVYEQARDEIIEKYDWHCARYRKAISSDSTDPTWEYSYRYLLPTSPYCLALRAIEDKPAYKLVGRYIETDYESPISIIYSKRITNPTELNPYLLSAIVLRIAYHISYHIAPSESLRHGIMKDLQQVIVEAKAASALAEDSKDEDFNSTSKSGAEWLTAGR